MVKLFIFFISFSVNASTLVSITNSDGVDLWQEFDTLIEADNYISKTKHRWGKLAGWRSDNCVGQTATRVNSFGFTEYNCPDQFTITKTDTTAKKAAQSALIKIKKDMDFGKSLYANIRLMNAGKSKAVRDAMRASFVTIRDALLDGDICSARVDISAIVPDANITAQNIADVLSLIDGYKTCI